MASYNAESLSNKNGYRGLIHMPGSTIEQILHWTLESLPDEILIGLDADNKRPHLAEVDDAFQGTEYEDGKFAGEGYVLGDATIVNRGDSFSVHHCPFPTRTRGRRADDSSALHVVDFACGRLVRRCGPCLGRLSSSFQR